MGHNAAPMKREELFLRAEEATLEKAETVQNDLTAF